VKIRFWFWGVLVTCGLFGLVLLGLLTPTGQSHVVRPLVTRLLSDPEQGLAVSFADVTLAWWRPELTIHDVKIEFQGAPIEVRSLHWKGWEWAPDENEKLKLGVLALEGVSLDLTNLAPATDAEDSAPLSTELLPSLSLEHLRLNDFQLAFDGYTCVWSELLVEDIHHESGAPLQAQLSWQGLTVSGPEALWTGALPIDVLQTGLHAAGTDWQLTELDMQVLGLIWDGDLLFSTSSESLSATGMFHLSPTQAMRSLQQSKMMAMDSLWREWQGHAALQNTWSGSVQMDWNLNSGSGQASIQDARGPLNMAIDSASWQWPEHLGEASFVVSKKDWMPLVGQTGFEVPFATAEVIASTSPAASRLVVRGMAENPAEISLDIDHPEGWTSDSRNFHLSTDVRNLPISSWISAEAGGLSRARIDAAIDVRFDSLALVAQGGMQAKVDGQIEHAVTFAARAPSIENVGIAAGWKAMANITIESDEFPLNAEGSWEKTGDQGWLALVDFDFRGIRPFPASQLPIFGQASAKIGHIKRTSAGAANGRWEGELAMRNINIMTDDRPIRLDRFDLFGHWNNREIQGEWASDWGHGEWRGDGRVDRWMAWAASEEHRTDEQPVPQAQIDLVLTRWRPLAVLLDLPLDISPGTRWTWSSDGLADAFESTLSSQQIRWAEWQVDNLFLNLDGNRKELFMTAALDSIRGDSRKYASDLNLDVHADSVWTVDLNWLGLTEEPSSIRMQISEPSPGQFEAELYALDFPAYGIPLSLKAPFPRLAYNVQSGMANIPALAFSTAAGELLINPVSIAPDALDLRLAWSEPNLPVLVGAPWFPDDLGASGPFVAQVEACGSMANPEVAARLLVADWASPAGPLEQVEIVYNGGLDAGSFLLDVQDEGQTVLGLHGQHLPGGDLSALLSFKALPADWLNPVLASGTIDLDGPLSGHLDLSGSVEAPKISGNIQADDVHATIGYLGTALIVAGHIDIGEDFIAFDNFELRDPQGHRARAIGTILHTDYADWNFDISLDMSQEPFALMDLSRTDNDLFFGKAIVTGWGNVSGSDQDLRIEADLATASGTTFALPMDRISTPTYAEFIQFKSATSPAERITKPDEELAQIRLKLGLDVREDAEARIIFNEALGDEIVGRTKGHLDLTINDFERFEMSGALEVVEGHYNLALSGLVQKRFDIDPGGTITWIRDPYGAEMNLVARHTVRTSLDNLLAGTTDLPGRMPVDLRLDLKGALLRPDISFEVELPRANPQLQAMVDNALFDEDEKNRQAISLLALGQFISQDPNVPLIADVSLTEQSTALLTAQLGNWLSSLSKGVDVGLNYGSNNLGEQEVAVALSTQFLDDRLHIEGEARGTTPGIAVSQADVQLQDLRVAYDITEDGRVQISGYRETAPGWNGLDGSTTMGIGIRFREQFDEWRELFRRKNP
jgi:hypothetical protein